MNDTISHAFIPGRLAKQKVVQAELEEKLSKSEENLDIAQTKSNVSRSFSTSPRPRATWVDHFIERDHK